MKTNTTMEKRFEGLKDFNLIYISNFKRVMIPSIIPGQLKKKESEKITVRNLFFKKSADNPDLPQEVLEKFKETNEDTLSINGVVYKKVLDPMDGNVYFESYDDLAPIVNEIINLPGIQSSLAAMEKSLKAGVMTKDLLSLQGFNPIETEFGLISLYLYDDYQKENNLRECKVALSFTKDGYSYSQDLGILQYHFYGKRMSA